MDTTIIGNGIHDLKNQLLELRLAWDLLAEEQGIELSDAITSLLDIIHETTDFLQEVLKVPIEKRPVELQFLFDNVQERFHDKGIFLPPLNAGKLLVVGNAFHLEWILYAIISISLLKFDGNIHLEVEDNNDELCLVFKLNNCMVKKGIKKGIKIACNLGPATINSLVDLQGGQIKWNFNDLHGTIKLILPKATRISLSSQ